MESDSRIDSLARRARLETIPQTRVAVALPRPAVYRLPRTALSLSAFGSLAAACVLLVMGLHARHVGGRSQGTTAGPADASGSVLFSPLDVEIR